MQVRYASSFGSCSGRAIPDRFTVSAQQGKPNILFILADNTGFGDLGAYGGGELRGAPTPRIDQLAAEGLRLTQFLVEPSCTPSRAALMTGRYSIRSGLSLVAVKGTTFSLPASEVTLAEALHDIGYATAIFGKWHLGAEVYSQPQNQGFDEFLRHPARRHLGRVRHDKAGASDQDSQTFPLMKGHRSSKQNEASL